MYTQRDTEFWKNDFRWPICPASFSFSLSSSFSLRLALLQESSCVLFRSLSLVTCVTCARTRLTYIHQEMSIIIDSKSQLKHRNAVACLYKIPKNTIPYYGLCCWMTLVTVRWLFVGSFSFRFRVFLFDARHLVARKVSSPTERA